MKPLTGLAAAVVLLLAAPSASVAQTTLPVGKAHGVRVVREQGAITVIFTQRAAKLYKRIAGKIVEVECVDEAPEHPGPPRAHAFLTPQNPGGITTVSSGITTMRAPKHRRKLATGDLTRGMDYCRVWRPARTVRRGDGRQRIPRRVIVSVPLTQAGAVFLDEESKARRLLLVLTLAGLIADDLKLSGWPSYAQLVDSRFVAGRPFVNLANPTDSPPRRTIGYYSDRDDHVAVATMSRAGKRLFIESAGDAVSTNLLGYFPD